MRSHRTVPATDSIAPARPERASGPVSGHTATPSSAPGDVLPDRWRLWEDEAHDGVVNMATDQALLATVQPGEGVWRWYGWSAPTVSFGRNERVSGRYSPAWLSAQGLRAVRRPTGGRALLHFRELTYSVTMPLAASASWRAAYDAINTILLEMLQAIGVQAERAAGHGAVSPDGPVCFEQPAEGELTVAGRKLVGSAVWRQGDAYLQHGSILLHDDQHRLVAGHAGNVVPPPAATLSAVDPNRSDEAWRAAVQAATRECLQRFATVQPIVLPTAWPDVLASQQRHFAAPAWLWRR